MDFAEIRSHLCCNTSDALANEYANKSFWCVQLVGGASGPVGAGTVAFAASDAGPHVIDAPGVLVCRVAGTLPDVGLAVDFADEASWLAAYSRLGEAFREVAQRKERLLGLMDVFGGGADLATIVNAAADIVGAPCSVLDNSFSFLAASDGFPRVVAGGEERRSRSLPADALEFLSERGLMNLRGASGLEVFSWEAADGRTLTNHRATIRERDFVMGTVSFFTDSGPLPSSRQELICYVARILAVELRGNVDFRMNSALSHGRLLRQLVLGDAGEDADLIRERFELFGHRLGAWLNIYVLDHSDDYLPYEQVQALAQRLQPMLGNSIYLIGDSDVLFLGSSDKPDDLGLIDDEGVEVNLMGLGTRLGISSAFADPRLAQSAAEEARRAIALGRRLDPSRKVFAYDRFRIDDVADRADSRLTLRLACFPPLMRLIERDEQEASQLALTLYEHLRAPQDPGLAAGRLYIHKNTLYYRLDKVRKLMGCDFRDAETVARIQLTFHILRATDDAWRALLRDL